jgi:hypothetical protein
MELSGELHVSAASSPGDESRYALDNWYGGPQSRSGRCGVGKYSLPMPGIELQPVAWRYTDSAIPASGCNTVWVNKSRRMRWVTKRSTHGENEKSIRNISGEELTELITL